MARQPRLDLPGIAQHVVQRGNDRQVCFATDTDYLRYLQELREASSKHDCAIHAYVLMTNHVHLLVTPAAIGGISRMMQAVGRRYVGSFNARYRRTGTLWEGRFKAALVDTDRYLLTCYRYIELNPVRAHMTNDPADYPWSSYHHNALGQYSPLITPHAQYTSLGATSDARQTGYRSLIDEHLEEKHLAVLRQHTQQQRAWGSERFQQQIEVLTQRSVSVRPRGRPAKASKTQD
jgi:putative transposase